MGSSAATTTSAITRLRDEQDFRYQNGAASRSIPHLGVNIDVDNGELGLDFNDGSSPSDTDDSELPWAASYSCMYHFMRQVLRS